MAELFALFTPPPSQLRVLLDSALLPENCEARRNTHGATTDMIDTALSLLALAACSDLLLQFARVRGWHPADVFQNALYVLFALPALASLILAFASPTPAVLAFILFTLFMGAGAWLGAVISAPRALQRPAVLGLAHCVAEIREASEGSAGTADARTESAAANRHQQELVICCSIEVSRYDDF